MNVSLENKNKDRKILNLGCGNDFYGTHRLDMFETPSTTDVSDLNQNFPYPDNYFDEIYCKSVLEHIKNLGNFSNECYRVLKKGGKLWLRTDHAGFILAYLLRRHEPNQGLEIQYLAGGFGHQKKKGMIEDHHYALFVESHLKYLFGNLKNHQFGYIYGGSNPIEKFIFRIMPKKIGACHIEMEARK